MSTPKTWFVTGASQGLGLTLVKRLLREGHQVAATSRNKDSLAQAVGTDSAAFLPLQVDLASDASVQQAIAQAIRPLAAWMWWSTMRATALAAASRS
jgi:NAD(P)-dependent dehydrogenase (short-subunit alcohol dehydrogenase family)